MKRVRKLFLLSILALGGACILLAAGLAISNLGLPDTSPVIETLSDADKIRLAEALNLRKQTGESVWPGWGRADIPAIVYNEEYTFIAGYADPPDGWVKVPAGLERGAAWQLVPGDSFLGEPYYRQRLTDPGVTPEAFTVMVGERWVSSMPTLDWFRIGLVHQISEDLPPFIRPVFPYRLFTGQLVSGSDHYISLSAHEAFHSLQGMTAPAKFAEAESASRSEAQYPWDDGSLQADWQSELDLLAAALRSTDDAQTLALARQFLAVRTARREAANLTPELVAYEQHREWLEGLARYVELEIWRQAAAGNYLPISDTSRLADFEDYAGFENRWSRELDQLTRMADDQGEGRFYYTGMAQAVLLDRLAPGWKLRAFDDDAYLENLLGEAARVTR